ncbi:hypothetical protein D7319_14355 [Streptomyces radicis]|uniref:Uncharacterized protein n=1 Tax=Streptomyces radicis TaxID=1750517 RepID=A0A3A9W5Y4_9ACTN|nr:hypothetical protein D7319_14355 [Streptomyces radicis]RKN21736.1 hypothetical protein D7318_15310 [Streptomyces radicis]
MARQATPTAACVSSGAVLGRRGGGGGVAHVGWVMGTLPLRWWRVWGVREIVDEVIGLGWGIARLVIDS